MPSINEEWRAPKKIVIHATERLRSLKEGTGCMHMYMCIPMYIDLSIYICLYIQTHHSQGPRLEFRVYRFRGLGFSG